MDREVSNLNELFALAQTKVSLAMGLTIYLKAPLYAAKPGVNYFVEQFLSRFEGRLTWYIDFKMSGAKKATPKLVRYPLRWLNDPAQAADCFGWFTYEASRYQDAPTILLQAKSEAQSYRYLSYLKVLFPVAMFERDYEEFVDLVRDWIKDLPFFFGYGGFFFSESLVPGENESNSKYVFAVANRFPGVEVDSSSGPSLTLRDSIKGVNWLTLFNDDFLAKLGGLEKLSSQLSREIRLHRLPSGLMLQAGKEPQAGDVNAGDRIPLYREVARALKPIRTKELPPLGHASCGSFGDQGTLEWLRRFDD
jgi:hypothetical protein